VAEEVANLQAQIARTATPAEGAAGPNVAGLTEVFGEYLDLYRDYLFAQALYEVYSRSSEEVAVEMLAGETASDVQVIEAAHLDPDRKNNVPAVAALALVILLALFTEIYAPATGLDLRLGRRGEGELGPRRTGPSSLSSSPATTRKRTSRRSARRWGRKPRATRCRTRSS
jgi:hypothetical protein